MKITTTYDPKPIPLRSFDWTAIDSDTYDGAPDAAIASHVGCGPSENAAIADLLDTLEDNLDTYHGAITQEDIDIERLALNRME